MEAIIICGMPASGKTTLARAVAKRLGLRHFDGGDALKEIAKRNGFRPTKEGWWDTNEGIKFLAERNANPSFDKEADALMKKMIARGNVVVTSWTMPWLSKTGFKVWLDTSKAERTKRMARRDGMTLANARAYISVRDRENKRLYKKMYKIKLGIDLKPFDLVIDTAGLSPEEMAVIVIKAVRGR